MDHSDGKVLPSLAVDLDIVGGIVLLADRKMPSAASWLQSTQFSGYRRYQSMRGQCRFNGLSTNAIIYAESSSTHDLE